MLWNIICWIVIGGLIGWIAGSIMKSKNSWLVNIIVGVIGSVIGGWIAGFLGSGGLKTFSILGVVFGVIGACIFIALLRLIRGKK